MAAVRALVVGHGSIGARHARLLREMGCVVAVVSSRETPEHRRFASLDAALDGFAPGYVVIASVTSRHGEDLQRLADLGFKGVALVEKPLFMTAPDPASHPAPSYGFPVFVAYNLRFHPVTQAFGAALAGRRVLAANALVGQHLSQWRPDRAPADTYSAHRGQGGGVVRDLSHEFDLAAHLFGPLTLRGGFSVRAGAVTVDSEDVAAAVFTAPACPLLSIHVNYLDHRPRRRWVAFTEDATVEADLVGGAVTVNDRSETVAFSPDESYRRMHRAATSGGAALCSWEEGLALMTLIDTLAPR
ncbi:MAG: gfo/Idh/MocA family oxidoreductase [Rhodobacterales bacterium CG_4_10_14_0_8_um_filter_70_9]|nr:MAG: gfo/Idh/MocA family oxidoreductase [Rhodobacterales bacterium CG_4_10_14_0_8_um_filter_70_9]